VIIDPRLIRAEALKLYKRHGMIALSVALTAGLAVLAFGIGAVQHAADPARYRPAGGLRHYREALSFLDLMLLVVGAVVGSTAGAADLESGVFRDLAATGRSRFALYAARTPGAWAIVLPLAVLVSAIAGAAALVFAGSSASPGVGALVAGSVSLLGAGALGCALAVGLATVIGARGPTIATLLACELVIGQVLAQVSFLSHAREVLPGAALDRIAEMPLPGIDTPLAVAWLVLAGWLVLAVAAGATRTQTREI
jgi:hypothetical protein